MVEDFARSQYARREFDPFCLQTYAIPVAVDIIMLTRHAQRLLQENRVLAMESSVSKDAFPDLLGDFEKWRLYVALVVFLQDAGVFSSRRRVDHVLFHGAEVRSIREREVRDWCRRRGGVAGGSDCKQGEQVFLQETSQLHRCLLLWGTDIWSEPVPPQSMGPQSLKETTSILQTS